MGNYNRDDRRGGGRSFGNRNSGGGRPDMHRATCSDCGSGCEVPFKPTGAKPVFCSNCFEKQGGGSSRPSFGGDRGDRRDRPSFGDRQKFDAVCDKCNNDCQVPFRPSAGKPIFCDNCFEKGAKGGKDSGGGSYEEFKAINTKLDMIMDALGLSADKTPKKEKKENKKDKEVTFVEEKVAKKRVKKVPAKKAVKKVAKKAVKKVAKKAPAKKKAAPKKKAPAKKKPVAKKKVATKKKKK